MTWTQTLQELRIMGFKRIYTGWKTKTMTQEQTADPQYGLRTKGRHLKKTQGFNKI